MILSLAAETSERVPLTEFSLGEVLGTAIMGMLIVFTVLLLIAVFIATLPRLLDAVAGVYPEVTAHQHATVDPSKSLLPDEATLVAIGYVLHTELQREVGSFDSGPG